MIASIEKRYQIAREQYAEYDVDTDRAMAVLETIPLSLPCWQADDLNGLENGNSSGSSGGLMVTGNYPGRAGNLGEIQSDLVKVLSLIPGKHRVNLHAMYGDFGNKKVDRDEIAIVHFKQWMEWAESLGICLDFNSTYFNHSKANSGFTLSSKDRSIRRFWIEHGKRCREIAAKIGEFQGDPCIHDTWIPDGCKDLIIDKWAYRDTLRQSLDELFAKTYPKSSMRDALESKLFGIGSETFVVGSYDFYMGYVLKNDLMICLDMGHFHPTESVGDKLSAILQFTDALLLHVTRGVRWDSDHVPVMNHELQELAHEIIRNRLLDKVILALDFFDAGINRIAAYVIGVRATLKALLAALLEPVEQLKTIEKSDKNHIKLALAEHVKTLSVGAVWDYYCLKKDVPPASLWLKDVEQYESKITGLRVE